MSKPKIWRLKKGEEARFKAGHPWVFSNELQDSPKGIGIGDPIELRDPGGEFLARGYGNPQSLIAFRALSRDESEEQPFSQAGMERRLNEALALRRSLGYGEGSYRLFYAEADGIPGLIVDAYAIEEGTGRARAFVLQAQTGGADRMTPWVVESLSKIDSKAAILSRNEAQSRVLDGLKTEGLSVLKEGSAKNLEKALITVGIGESALPMRADLMGGQKTGFFLDQVSNALRMKAFLPKFSGQKEIRALDLCCYVGQWSARFAGLLKGQAKLDVAGLDASAQALAFAQENVERAGGAFHALEGDAFKDIDRLDDGMFDVVFCDPPALITGRKHVPEGKKAYQDLNAKALRKLKPGGVIVSSSCSGLLPEAEFRDMLAKSMRRSGARVVWVDRGAQAPDHPMLAEFPEGTYLKTAFGVKRA